MVQAPCPDFIFATPVDLLDSACDASHIHRVGSHERMDDMKAMHEQYGVISHIDAGQVLVLNTWHPLRHLLARYGWGYCVTQYAGGDHSLERRECFSGEHAEREARAFFETLRQGE
jgi:hypothetical protein